MNTSLSRHARNTSSAAERSNNQTAALSAKKEIRSKLREDWTWPEISLGSDVPHFSEALNLPSAEGDWDERASDTSYDLLEATDSPQSENHDGIAKIVKLRKRRRHQMVRDELVWNTGFGHYTRRRDAWSGARPQSSPSVGHTHRNEQSCLSGSELKHPDLVGTPHEYPTTHEKTPSEDYPIDAGPTLIPRAPPILSHSNPVRAGITPATYDSIYSKVIIQGLSPTIPINLSDIVGSLVQGWKKDGEWPPKTEAEKADEANSAQGIVDGGGMRDGGKKLAKRGVGRMKSVLGIGRGQLQGNDAGPFEDGGQF